MFIISKFIFIMRMVYLNLSHKRTMKIQDNTERHKADMLRMKMMRICYS